MHYYSRTVQLQKVLRALQQQPVRLWYYVQSCRVMLSIGTIEYKRLHNFCKNTVNIIYSRGDFCADCAVNNCRVCKGLIISQQQEQQEIDVQQALFLILNCVNITKISTKQAALYICKKLIDFKIEGIADQVQVIKACLTAIKFAVYLQLVQTCCKCDEKCQVTIIADNSYRVLVALADKLGAAQVGGRQHCAATYRTPNSIIVTY